MEQALLYSSFYYYGFDWTYLLVLVGLVISLICSARVKSTYKKYERMRATSGMTGCEAAQRILYTAGIRDVKVEHVSGNLTDHFDPRSGVLRLSDGVYNGTSVAAIGVAAHECGHAIQNDTGYVPLKLRGALVPVANFGTRFSWLVIIAGVILSQTQFLINIGIFMFSLGVLFQLITLPVEFNASRRAVAMLDETGILYGEEVGCARKVLSAAALTYVAAAAAMSLQLLRLIILFGGRRRN